VEIESGCVVFVGWREAFTNALLMRLLHRERFSFILLRASSREDIMRSCYCDLPMPSSFDGEFRHWAAGHELGVGFLVRHYDLFP
jgi:hypothetical protein